MAKADQFRRAILPSPAADGVSPPRRLFFISGDAAAVRQVRGQRHPMTAERLLRRIVRVPPRKERVALIYGRDLPAPATLPTDDPLVDDAMLAAVIRTRMSEPRRETGWHLRGRVHVMPGRPFVFLDDRFVAASAGTNRDQAQTIWRYYPRRLLARPTMRVERAILMRDMWDFNYWHLLHDVLPRFAMADALGIDRSIPVIVSPEGAAHLGKLLAGTAFATERPIIVQPHGTTIACHELYLLRPGILASHWTPEVIGRIPSDPPPQSVGTRIYCRRKAGTSFGRGVANADEVEAMFRDAGFTAIDPGSLTIRQQRAVFERAEVIAGIDGAAFANALFRSGRPLAIGSLSPSNWLSTIFPMLAKVYGFRFHGRLVVAASDDPHEALDVPRDTVMRLIDGLLANEPRRRQ